MEQLIINVPEKKKRLNKGIAAGTRRNHTAKQRCQ